MRLRRYVIWPMIFRATIAFALLLTGAALTSLLSPRLQADSNTSPVIHVAINKGTQPTYAIEAGIDGEIFPAFANYASLQRPKERQIGTFTVTVTNSSENAVSARISVEVPGWSDTEIQNISVGAGEVRRLLFAPTFFPKLYTNYEIAAATGVLRVTNGVGKTLDKQTVPVRLRSANDIYWGNSFQFAPFIASWVMPHDARVEAVLTRAKEFMPGRRLPGYEPHKSADEQRKITYAQAKAIYHALQLSGVSYVKSSLTFGRNTNVSERVRLPGESIARSSANCIDGVVMYASLFENLGMDPEVVLVPGHAYVAVREAPQSDNFLYIETAVTGRAPFDAAVKSASRGMAKWTPKDITRIRIQLARDAGIYPMPLPGHDPRHLPVEEAPVATSASTLP